MIATQKPDVLVAEAGASPFELYNGAIAMAELQAQKKTNERVEKWDTCLWELSIGRIEIG
jgi:hypothetical protein